MMSFVTLFLTTASPRYFSAQRESTDARMVSWAQHQRSAYRGQCSCARHSASKLANTHDALAGRVRTVCRGLDAVDHCSHLCLDIGRALDVVPEKHQRLLLRKQTMAKQKRVELLDRRHASPADKPRPILPVLSLFRAKTLKNSLLAPCKDIRQDLRFGWRAHDSTKS